jgi:thiol-disulfide isomerase/thioredoxin
MNDIRIPRTLFPALLIGLLASAASAGAPAPEAPAVTTVPGGTPVKATAPTWVENPSLTLRMTAQTSQGSAAATPAATGGEVFDSSDYQSILLLPVAGDAAYVLDLKAVEALAYPKSSVMANDGTLQRPDRKGARSLGRFETDPDGRIRFSDGASEIATEPAPPLIGPLTRAKLEERQPGYARRTRIYHPDAAMVAKLAGVKRPVQILAFFGTWCQICKHHLPALLATLDAARNPKLELSLVGIDENVAEPRGLITQYRVMTTPTILVLVDGQELGRIEEDPRISVEADLADILVGPGEGGR